MEILKDTAANRVKELLLRNKSATAKEKRGFKSLAHRRNFILSEIAWALRQIIGMKVIPVYEFLRKVGATEEEAIQAMFVSKWVGGSFGRDTLGVYIHRDVKGDQEKTMKILKTMKAGMSWDINNLTPTAMKWLNRQGYRVPNKKGEKRRVRFAAEGWAEHDVGVAFM